MNIVLMDSLQSVSFTTNFVGKVAGSTLENPSIAKPYSAFALLSPNNASIASLEYTQVNYINVSALNGALVTKADQTNLAISQQLFSFDLISLIERKYGTIPAVGTTAKAAWLKANVASLTCNWWGYGSSPTGNKASLTIWRPLFPNWLSGAGVRTTSNGVVTKMSIGSGTTGDSDRDIDANGFVHFLAYAEPSNGTITSTINTDYAELEITFFNRQ